MQTFNTDLESLRLRIFRLSTISAEGVQRVADFVEAELKRVGANAESLSPLEREVAARAGISPDLVAAHKAKIAATAKIVSSIPHDKLVMLRCLHGGDQTAIANAWVALRSLGSVRR